jgi:hypothetical protein
MKKRLLKSLLIVFGGYIALVLLRFLYLELDSHEGDSVYVPDHGSGIVMREAAYKSKISNYATLQIQTASGVADQKYEKVADVESTTSEFDRDESGVRNLLKTKGGVLQSEFATNKRPHRALRLVIGVPPGLFDDFVKDLSAFGRVDNIQTTKTDKTNDYLELNARRAALTKTRDSLVALRERGGSIDELIKLEKSISELDEKLQTSNVQLGQFDKVNEFCTVNFSLTENAASKRGPNHFGNLIWSIEWAGPIYLIVVGIALVGSLAVLFLWGLLDKLGALEAKTNR